MNRHINCSASSKFALIAMLVCIGPALAQLPALSPGGPRPGGPSAAGPALESGGLPKENIDDSEETLARFGSTFAMMRPPLPADAPQPSPDPRNFEGTWFHADSLVMYIAKDMFGNPLPFTPEGRKVVKRRFDGIENGKPHINASAYCIPTGPFWQFDLNMPFNIVQTKEMMEMHFEEFHGIITYSFDAAKTPPAGYMGRSTAHWDGDTLVVETTGFKEGMWLTTRGSSVSKDLKLTQRIRKVKTGNNWHLEMIYTIDDPTYYTQPWSFARRYAWRPDMTLFRDYNCEVQTGAKDGMDTSLLPEPTN